jgi:hypothetical protein
MKYIITESQNLLLKKINFLQNYIEKILSEYEWFNGDVQIITKTWKHAGKTYPLYEIVLDTGGISYYSFDEGHEIEESIDTMFRLLFPEDDDKGLTYVWNVVFV